MGSARVFLARHALDKHPVPNTQIANAFRLAFAPDSLVRSKLSGAAFTGDWLWVAGDEACGLDRLRRPDPVGREALRFGEVRELSTRRSAGVARHGWGRGRPGKHGRGRRLSVRARLTWLEERKADTGSFRRSRWVALVAASATLLRAQRRLRLRLHIETGGTVRDVQTLTLFVGNNRM